MGRKIPQKSRKFGENPVENVPGGRGKNTPWPWEKTRGGRTEISEKIFSKSFRKNNLQNKFGKCFEKLLRGGRIGNGRGRGETLWPWPVAA